MNALAKKSVVYNKLNILVVDDDESALKAISFCLSPLGHHCTKEKAPENALKLYKQKPFDIVITDMQMPGMTGVELLKEVRAFDQNARVIIVTAFGDLETAKAAINNRAYGFLGKPVDVKEIYSLVLSIEREIRKDNAEKETKQKLEEALLKLKDVYCGLLVHLKSIDAGNGKNE